MVATAVEPAASPRLADLRAILNTATGTPTSRACAVACAGYRLGLPPGLVRRYVARSNDKSLSALAKNPIVWSRLSESAHRKVSASSAAGRAALRREVAKRLVGRLLLPVEVEGLTAHRLVRARVALATIGVDFLRGTGAGFEGGFVPEADLAVRMGVTRPTARAALTTCESVGWIAATKRAKGSAARYKLPPLALSTETAALVHLGLIERLGGPDHVVVDDVDDPELAALMAELPDDGRAVQVLQSVQHPAWSYSKAKGQRGGLTHAHWLVLLADQAGVDPVTLGLVDRSVRSARRELDRAGVGPHLGSLVDQLDRVADRTGADQRSRDAWAKRTAEKAQRAADRSRVTAERADARAAAKAARTKRPKAPAGPRAAGPVQQQVVRIPLPVGFDVARHMGQLTAKVEAVHGPGWSITVEGDVALATRPTP